MSEKSKPELLEGFTSGKFPIDFEVVKFFSGDRKGHEYLEELLKAGANIREIEAHSGMSFLLDERCIRNPKASMMLYEQGASVDKVDNEGRNPLHLIVLREPSGSTGEYSDYHSLLDLIVKDGVDINTQDNEGNTPLHHQGSNLVEKLLELGADVHIKNNEGRNPLHGVKSEYNAKLMLDAGADINAQDNEGKTPIFFSRNEKLAEYLVGAGADIEAKDHHGQTVLHCRVNETWFDEDGYPSKAVNYFADISADINIQDNEGKTPLHLADNMTAFFTLIDNGASLEVKDSLGNNPINNRDEFGNTPLHKANAELSKRLIAAGAEVNARNEFGETPLHEANDRRKARILIEAGADFSIKDDSGRLSVDAVRDDGVKSLIKAEMVKQANEKIIRNSFQVPETQSQEPTQEQSRSQRQMQRF